jgi:hypothetical protein
LIAGSVWCLIRLCFKIARVLDFAVLRGIFSGKFRPPDPSLSEEQTPSRYCTKKIDQASWSLWRERPQRLTFEVRHRQREKEKERKTRRRETERERVKETERERGKETEAEAETETETLAAVGKKLIILITLNEPLKS